MKLRLIELFAGYGSQALALKYENIQFEHWLVCDFDKYAIQAYNQLHGTNFPTTDIRNVTAKDLNIVDTNQFTYLLTYSFPCQDLSKAGKGKGMSKDDNTRSGLLWEVERLLNECKELPQYLLMENVPDVIGSKNIKDFAKWIEFLDRLGYKSYYQLLNAKDYGIPQNRERCFMVSVLDKSRIFQFPKPIKLELRLKDFLEDTVDEKYFLSENVIKKLKNKNINREISLSIRSGGRGSLDRHEWDLVVVKVLGEVTPNSQSNNIKTKEYANYITWEDSKGRLNTQDHRAFLPERISGTVPAMERGIPKILIPEATKKGYAETHDGDGVYINRPHQKRRVVQKGMIQTLKCTGNDVEVVVAREHLKVRKLTPRECWRLMGVKDDDFDKLHDISNRQLYKLAGNSIVTNVLQAIFRKMFIDTTVENYQMSLFDLESVGS